MADTNKMAELGIAAQDGAKRYLEAVYGETVWFRAPETFGNLIERWIWALAAENYKLANGVMDEIVAMAKAHHGAS